jgi:NitT/TauT family transport system substrate-binding protein
MIFALMGLSWRVRGGKHGLGMLIQSMNFTMDVSGQFSCCSSCPWSACPESLHLAHPEAGASSGTRPRKRRSRHERSHGNRHPARHGSGSSVSAAAQTKIVMGWCSRTISSATPLRHRHQDGLVQAEASTSSWCPRPARRDCVKNVAHREVWPARCPAWSRSPWAGRRASRPRSSIRPTRATIYGIAVARGQPGARVLDLSGKRIGVTSHGGRRRCSSRARSPRATVMNPDSDINVVCRRARARRPRLCSGRGQVDALVQFDTQYAHGGERRRSSSGSSTRATIDRFPSNGFLASEETLRTRRRSGGRLAKGYAKGTVFAIANPRRPCAFSGTSVPGDQAHRQDEATALRDDVKVLQARIVNWSWRRPGEEMGRELRGELRGLQRTSCSSGASSKRRSTGAT